MTDSELYQLKNENLRLKSEVERLTKELTNAKLDRDEAIKYAAKRGSELPKRELNPETKKWE